MAEQLAREPLLFESLAGQPEQFFSGERGWEFLLGHDARRFKLYNEFKTILRFLTGEKRIEGILSDFSQLAEVILHDRFRQITGSEKTCLLAMGKLGGGEISYSSDLDLLLLYDGASMDPADAEQIATSFVASFQDHTLYEVDFRLRPEGKSAPLATEIRYYEEYLATRSSLWERQSLIKARVLFGNNSLQERFERLAEEAIFSAALPPDWESGIIEMRKRMVDQRSKNRNDLKVGKGGLVDLEFAIQILQLRHGRNLRSLRVQNSFDAVSLLSREGMIGSGDAKTLRLNLERMRSLELLLRINTGENDFCIPEEKDVLSALAAALNIRSVDALRAFIKKMRVQNRRLFSQAAKQVMR